MERLIKQLMVIQLVMTSERDLNPGIPHYPGVGNGNLLQ